MNLTLSVDAATLRRARRAAEAMGKSVNQLVRDYLVELAAREDDQVSWLEELQRLGEAGQGRSGGWKFRREEIYE